MDPTALSNSEWTNIGRLLINLWIFLGLMLAFAFSLLMGHALIPSLVATRHLPERLEKMRPALYTVALVFFGLAMFFIARATSMATVIAKIYERWWI